MRLQSFGVDVARVTVDEATELMTHHLMLAHSYFEVADDKTKYEELSRIMEAKDVAPDVAAAAMGWMRALDAYYAKLRKEQGP